jgi:hypothetical protein
MMFVHLVITPVWVVDLLKQQGYMPTSHGFRGIGEYKKNKCLSPTLHLAFTSALLTVIRTVHYLGRA